LEDEGTNRSCHDRITGQKTAGRQQDKGEIPKARYRKPTAETLQLCCFPGFLEGCSFDVRNENVNLIAVASTDTICTS
jgi:hypothetical protein